MSDDEQTTIEVRENGHLRVTGPFRLVDQQGNEIPIPDGPFVKLCRCGASANRPFCDGEHARIGFQAP
jgi:CDGSH-type Zn-finger protein